MRWAVAITTAPRKEPTLERCVESVRQAGWEPTIFAEPGSVVISNTHTITNKRRLGVWYNWREACEWCLMYQPNIVLTIQDDVVIHPDTKEFVESFWEYLPNDLGMLSLYTPQHYQHWFDGTKRDFGIYEVETAALWGACAMCFPPKQLRKLLDHPRSVNWVGAQTEEKWEIIRQRRKDNPHTIQNSDTAIGIILRGKMKQKLVYMSPSPTEHIAKFSSCGHGTNTDKRNAQYVADFTRPLKEQIPWEKQTLLEDLPILLDETSHSR